MYIDFASDWPAYVFMVLFIVFVAYVIIKGNSKEEEVTESKASEVIKKK